MWSGRGKGRRTFLSTGSFSTDLSARNERWSGPGPLQEVSRGRDCFSIKISPKLSSIKINFGRDVVRQTLQ